MHLYVEILQNVVSFILKSKSEPVGIFFESLGSIHTQKRMINESEEILAQKRGEMAYLNRECRKLRERFIDYHTHNLKPITHSEPNTDSHSTQIVPYNKE